MLSQLSGSRVFLVRQDKRWWLRKKKKAAQSAEPADVKNVSCKQASKQGLLEAKSCPLDHSDFELHLFPKTVLFQLPHCTSYQLFCPFKPIFSWSCPALSPARNDLELRESSLPISVKKRPPFYYIEEHNYNENDLHVLRINYILGTVLNTLQVLTQSPQQAHDVVTNSTPILSGGN